MATVSINGVGKRFGTLDVLRDVSISIPDGAFVALVGPSGCGKSTLLRMIAGLEEVSWGEIIIGDRDVTDLPPKARDIAMVFQNYALYPHMTVAQNMGFSLRINRKKPQEIAGHVGRASGILGLDALLDRFPRQLSGGQRQRVAMGRAIVRDPALFLFDEPLSNLDAKLRVQMRAEIKDLHQRLGTTTIYVTHDQVEAMTMADQIVVMRDGDIEQIGSPLDLYDRPCNQFVAGFIGSPSMNFFSGRTGDSGFRLTDGTVFPIGAHVDRAVTCGIRPEHLRRDDTGVEIEAVVVEPTGSETQVVARLGSQSIVAVFRERLAIRPGDRLRVSADAAHLHVFDDKGVRITGMEKQ
jgi:multiple sugar transport system ATP-binding protein